MKNRSVQLFVIMLFLVWGSIPTVTGQVTQKTVNKPVGEVVTNGDQVTINGTSAQRGSVVFDGSEIQTGEASAFVNFTSGGGVLSIAPGTQVKVSREASKIVAKVLKGSVTVRSPLASTVIAPDRIVNSGPDNLYTVSVSGSGAIVNSLSKPLAVQVSEGVVQTVAAEAAGAAKEAIAKNEPSDQPAQQPSRQPSGISANCRLSNGNTVLTVQGVVGCQGNVLPGVRVDIYVQLRTGQIYEDRTTTNQTGRYSFTFNIPALPPGYRGAAHVIARPGIRGCPTVAARCYF